MGKMSGYETTDKCICSKFWITFARLFLDRHRTEHSIISLILKIKLPITTKNNFIAWNIGGPI